MVDVFISYKRDERARAQRIANKLQALGLDAWLDARIPSGVSFDAEIERALIAAKAVLVLWTPGAVASDWVRNEANAGKERGVLVALMLSPCELPIAFRSVQYEPLLNSNFEDDDPAWIRTLERIKDLVGRRNAIDLKQRRMLRGRKSLRALGWLASWPVVGALTVLAVAYLLAPLQGARPGMHGFSDESWDSGFVYALGSVEVEGEALPTNHAEISCRREEQECLEARAELRDGELTVFTDRREIVRWDDSIVIARSSTPCADIVTTLDRALRTVNTVRQRRPSTENDPLCSWMSARNSYRLVDGAARANALESRRQSYFVVAAAAALLAWSIFVLVRIISIFRR